MAGNTSATGGYLSPQDATPPLEDDGLEDFFNGVIAGITGLNGDTQIIPSWSEEPPNLPARNVNWIAFRVKDKTGDAYASVIHNPGDDTNIPPGINPGSSTIMRQELLSLECSFYGPGAGATASLFREGLSVSQNREAMRAAGFGLLSVGAIQAIPSLIKEKWLYREVLTATFRRTVARTYPVLDLKSAGGEIKAEQPASSDVIDEAFEATRG